MKEKEQRSLHRKLPEGNDRQPRNTGKKITEAENEATGKEITLKELKDKLDEANSEKTKNMHASSKLIKSMTCI